MFRNDLDKKATSQKCLSQTKSLGLEPQLLLQVLTSEVLFPFTELCGGRTGKTKKKTNKKPSTFQLVAPKRSALYRVWRLFITCGINNTNVSVTLWRWQQQALKWSMNYEWCHHFFLIFKGEEIWHALCLWQLRFKYFKVLHFKLQNVPFFSPFPLREAGSRHGKVLLTSGGTGGFQR